MSRGAGLRRLILHVGRHKTGTSALQAALAAGRDDLARQGVVYPRLPPATAEVLGAPSADSHPTLARALNPGWGPHDGLPVLARAIGEQIRATPEADTLLLSSEAFQNLRDPALVQAYVADLGVAEVRVIAYLREHLDYAMSSWRQGLQAQGRFRRFSRYAGRMKDLGPFVALWQTVGRLELDWYDAALARHGDIVADFLDRTGLELPARPAGRPNPSIGGNLLYARLLACRDARPFLPYAAMERLAAAERGFRQPPRISDALAAELREASPYNASATTVIGPPPVLKSWADCPDLPHAPRLAGDIVRLQAAGAARPPDLSWLNAAGPEAADFYL